MGLFSSLFGKDSAPQVPSIDPNQLISRQAQVNRINQATPFGSLTFTGPDRSNAQFKLSPQFQQLLNAQTGYGRQSTGLAASLLGQIPGSMDAATNAILARMGPSQQMEEARLRNRLEQSGNPAAYGSTGMSEGAFNELGLMNQRFNDARMAAVLAGPQYQQQLANTAQGLAMNQPISVPQYQFQGASPIDVMNPYQLSSQAAQFNAQQQAQANQNMLGGLFDIAKVGIGFLGD